MAQQHLADAFVGGRTLQQHGQQSALGEVADPLGAQVRQPRTVLPLQTRSVRCCRQLCSDGLLGVVTGCSSSRHWAHCST